jgi:hypothetical protein
LTFLTSIPFATAPPGSCIHSQARFPALPCSSPITDRWTIKLGDADSDTGPIWPQSDGADSASSETLVAAVATLALIFALALLLPLVLSIEDMPSSSPAKPTPSNKTAETPADELPFPGRLVEGKYDVQYLHL